MNVYFDLIFIINFIFDFLLLMSVSIVLKRNIKIKKIILGSIIGSISLIFLFFKCNVFISFFIKIVIAGFIVLVTFSFKNIKYFFNNLIYFYLNSIVLGGSLYLLNNNFLYKNFGFLVVKNNYRVCFIYLIIIFPIILFLYIYQIKKLNNNYNDYYSIEILFNGNIYNFTGYVDSGNKVYDPYKKRPITFIYTDKINFDYEKGILVPYKTINQKGLLKCIRVDRMIINNKKIINNALVSLCDDEISIDGVDAILNIDLIGGLND